MNPFPDLVARKSTSAVTTTAAKKPAKIRAGGTRNDDTLLSFGDDEEGADIGTSKLPHTRKISSIFDLDPSLASEAATLSTTTSSADHSERKTSSQKSDREAVKAASSKHTQVVEDERKQTLQKAHEQNKEGSKLENLQREVALLRSQLNEDQNSKAASHLLSSSKSTERGLRLLEEQREKYRKSMLPKGSSER